MKYIYIIGLSIIILSTIYCRPKEPKAISKSDSTTAKMIKSVDSASMLRRNLKLIYPYYELIYDSIVQNTDKYSQTIIIDTIGSASFMKDRSFLGKLTNILAIKIKHGDNIILRSGKLKLWVFNLYSIKTKIPDTVLISPLIYGVRGDERTPGFPTVLTEVLVEKRVE